jgi:hypothetical protein
LGFAFGFFYYNYYFVEFHVDEEFSTAGGVCIMEFVDWFFLLQFLIVVALFLVKLFNVFKLGEWLSIEMVWMVLIVFWLFYGAGFVLLLNNPLSPTFWSLFTLESWLSRLFVVLFFVEFFFLWKSKYAPKDIQPYNPLDRK